jgi:hypothetical protein
MSARRFAEAGLARQAQDRAGSALQGYPMYLAFA